MLKGNPCVRKMPAYRRPMLVAMPGLAYLDDRPVHEVERIAIEAFQRGGKEEEKKARDEYAKKMNAW